MWLSRAESEEGVLVDESFEHEEVADGVLVVRRTVLRLGALSAALFGFAGVSRGQAAGGSTKDAFEQLVFAEFLDQIGPLAELAAREQPVNEDAFLFRLASMLVRLDRVSVPAIDVKPFPSLEDISTGDFRRERLVRVLEVRVAKGKTIPPHNHNHYGGALLGLDGQVRIRNFEIADGAREARSGATFVARETQNGVLIPGRVSTLSSTRDNLHEVTAGREGARLLDIFTFFEKPGQSSFFDLAVEAKDPQARLFEATWR